MTAPRGRYVPWQTLPEPRRQRLLDWYDDLEALESLIRFRLGLRRPTGPFGPSVFDVLLLNAWKTDGPWIPPGRLDLAGEYLEAARGHGFGAARSVGRHQRADKRWDAGAAGARAGHSGDDRG